MTSQIGRAPVLPRPSVGPFIAGALAFASLAFVSLAFGPPAHAQLAAPRDTTIDAQLFQPAIGPRNFITVEEHGGPRAQDARASDCR